jgi:hypothetical protein
MSVFLSSTLQTQNDLLLKSLNDFYECESNLEKMVNIINGETKISLRIVDWFVTNYAKKNYTIYGVPTSKNNDISIHRFKVYNDYKLKLKAYSKKRFDPFCRWERICMPFKNRQVETTIGQLNFFKWAIENKVIEYIESNYQMIEHDMNNRNSSSKNRNNSDINHSNEHTKTRKKREELSVSACKCIKKESVKIVVKFDL